MKCVVGTLWNNDLMQFHIAGVDDRADLNNPCCMWFEHLHEFCSGVHEEVSAVRYGNEYISSCLPSKFQLLLVLSASFEELELL